jgi:hypothetical protein
MYLNELILNWGKVETACSQMSDSPIMTLVSSVSRYTEYLTQQRFLTNEKKTYGFPAEHDVFGDYYLYDIVEHLLSSAGIKGGERGLVIKRNLFTSGVKLKIDDYESMTQKPTLEFSSSEKHLYVGLEFDMQYRLASRKNFQKATLYIPLIVFYIRKHFCLHSFKEIKQLRQDIMSLNPSAQIYCLTETVERKHLRQFADIQDIVYILRASCSDEPFKPLQPLVFLKIFARLDKFVNTQMSTFEQSIPFGHIDLLPK